MRKPLIILTSSLLLIGCSSTQQGHKHSFKQEWSYNETYHWHECKDETCDEEKDRSTHTFSNTEHDGHYYQECLCGYKFHRHVSGDEWEKDETYHWKKCLDSACNEILNKASHNYSHVEEDSIEYDICTICGKKMNETDKVDFKFKNIKEEYSLVQERANSYLTSEFDRRISYLSSMEEVSKPVTINWGLDNGISSLKIFYGLKQDYSDAIVEELDASTNEYIFYNLLKDSKYYVKLEETLNGQVKTIETSFKTSSIGPRPLIVDGIKNVRDLGGYELDGDKTKQGLLFRGGQLSPDVSNFNYEITDKGKKTMSEELGIKTEIDLRTPSESKVPLSNSLIPNAKLVFEVIDGYKLNAFKTKYKEIFQILSKPSSYPIYFHCTGGADRTGTLSYLINAFLGVSEIDLIHDYEFTSFSPYGVRSVSTGLYAGEEYWGNLMKELQDYSGDTTQEKARSYLLSTGLSNEQLNNFRLIMTGHMNEVIEK